MNSKISLRKITARDAPLLARWFNDQSLVGQMSTVLRCNHHTVNSVKKDIQNVDSRSERWFMVHIPEKKQPIGHGGIDDIHRHDQRGEVFFLLGDKAEWGKGFGTEIVRALVQYGFEKLRLHSLFASATITNISSQKVLEKAGFHRIGLRRGYNYINGKFIDEVFYDLTKKD